MTSHASWAPHVRATSGARAQTQRSGMVTFAAVMLFVLAFFNGLDGIAAINNARIFTGNTVLIVGDLRAWGWTVLALGIAQAFAGVSGPARMTG